MPGVPAVLLDEVEEQAAQAGVVPVVVAVVDVLVQPSLGEDPPNDWRPVSGSPLTWIRRS